MISFAHFTKQSCTKTDILITPESQYSYRKRITRGHIMFVFKTDKVPFTELHCTLESYPGLLLRISTHTQKKNLKGKKKIFTHKRKQHLFKKSLYEVVRFEQWFFFVASCLFSEQRAWWGSVCAGRGAGSGGHRGEHKNCGPNESKRMCRGHQSEEPRFLKPDLFWSGQQWRWIEGWLFNEFSKVCKSLWEAYNSAFLLEEIHPEHLCSC